MSNKEAPVSVLLSVYKNERPDYLFEALNSLVKQSLVAAQVVLVVDGPVPVELDGVITKFVDKLPLEFVRLPQNVGLARALNHGLARCRYDLIARMDTDDIATVDRLATQYAFMLDNPAVDVCGSSIMEFENSLERIQLIRNPLIHDEIARQARYRNPIAHPSVMYRKAAVEKAGLYPIVFPEDYALWSVMLVKGFRFANIEKPLLYMRVNKDFISRRGLNFFKGELKLLKFQRKIGLITTLQWLRNLCLRAAIRLPPKFVRRLIYKARS